MDINELEAKVRGSFSKVREDIDLLRKDLESLKNEFFNFEGEINAKLNDLSTKKANKDVFFVSTGNEGGSHHTPPHTTHNDTQYPTLKELQKEVENMFLDLTDREFAAFMAIYSIEKESKEVTYETLAKQLKIDQSWARWIVKKLISKNLPIIKERYFNGKVSLSIKKEFKDLNIYDNLLKFRKNTGQTSIFDYK